MKMYLFLISSLLLFLFSCEREPSENPLIGKWLDLFTCDSCLIYEFKQNNDLVLHNLTESDSITLYYAWLGNDLIEIEFDGKNEYEVEFYTADSIKIIGFSMSILDFNNTILKKIQ